MQEALVQDTGYALGIQGTWVPKTTQKKTGSSNLLPLNLVPFWFVSLKILPLCLLQFAMEDIMGAYGMLNCKCQAARTCPTILLPGPFPSLS